MSITNPELRKYLDRLLESDGYTFQMGLERRIVIGKEQGLHRWNIIAREHPWRDRDGEEAFIDLIITEWTHRMVLECKRLRGGVWLFLQPRAKSSETSLATCRWIGLGPTPATGVGDI